MLFAVAVKVRFVPGGDTLIMIELYRFGTVTTCSSRPLLGSRYDMNLLILIFTLGRRDAKKRGLAASR